MANSSGVAQQTEQERRKVCLLVDDDDDDREIFCMALSETDPSIRCLIAHDGIAAIKMLDDPTFVPDYIFLDLNMPLMTGKECLQQIRKLPRLSDVPVIIYSTSASQRDIQDSMELGASTFITKPPQIAVLADKLAEVLTTV